MLTRSRLSLGKPFSRSGECRTGGHGIGRRTLRPISETVCKKRVLRAASADGRETLTNPMPAVSSQRAGHRGCAKLLIVVELRHRLAHRRADRCAYACAHAVAGHWRPAYQQ